VRLFFTLCRTAVCMLSEEYGHCRTVSVTFCDETGIGLQLQWNACGSAGDNSTGFPDGRSNAV
jgi:hypothetical protein